MGMKMQNLVVFIPHDILYSSILQPMGGTKTRTWSIITKSHEEAAADIP